MNISEQVLNRILREIDHSWTLQRVDQLSGRASLLLARSSDECTRRLILLTHGERDRARNPHIARDEFRLLQSLHNAGLPVAQPLHLAATLEAPFFITSYIRGETCLSSVDLPTLCKKLADTLSAIHAIDLQGHDLSFLPRLTDMITHKLNAPTPEDDKIHSAMRHAYDGITLNKPVLLHGDFWLGNLLWEDGQLVGIIDWEDAMLGDPLGDLGKSRLEMLWALGADAAEIYTARYLARYPQLNASALPFWDLWGAARLPHFAGFAPHPGKIPQMQMQYDRFVADAIRALDAS